MKLNLLPTHVGREGSSKKAWILFVLIILGCGASSFMMITRSKEGLESAKKQANDYRPFAQATIDHANKAPGIINQAQPIVRNINLARAMDAHNSVYPRFYNQVVLPYIPSFFRITSLAASPSDANTVTVSMTGIIKTQQQYADLMLAMLRIPGAVTVARSGFTPTNPFLTGPSRDFQSGQIQEPGEPIPPKDPLDRLNFFIAQGSGPAGFRNQGGFGSGQQGTRGAMPESSLVTVSVVVPGHNLLTPNPRATLGLGAGGGGGRGGFAAG